MFNGVGVGTPQWMRLPVAGDGYCHQSWYTKLSKNCEMPMPDSADLALIS